MGWAKYKLGDILTRRRNSVKILPNDTYKLVTIKLYHKGVRLRGIAKGKDIKSSMSAIKAGDFILSGIDARNGAFGIVPDELDGAVVTNDFWCLDPVDGLIDKEFLLFLTTTDFFDNICKQSSDGTTQRIRLQKEKFFNYEISLPEVSEQVKLIGKLKGVKVHGEAVSLELTHQLHLVKKLRQQLLQDAVQGKLVAQNPEDEPANVLLQKIKAEKEQQIKDKKLKKEKELPPIKPDEIPFQIPENWLWCRLGEIIYDTEGGKSPNCLPEPATGKSWGVIKTTAVQELYFSEKDNKLLPKGFKVQDQHKIVEGDVLITRAGPKNRVGVVCYVENLSLNLILSDKTIRIKHNKALISSKYIALGLNSPLIKPYIETKMTGMADSQVNITQDNMKWFPLPLPPLKEQFAIVENLKEVVRICDTLEASIKQSQQQNQQLLQQVLREALNYEAIEPINNFTESIPIKSRIDEKYKAFLLASEIIWQLHNQPTLGRIKLQKLLFICERTRQMNLPVNFLKRAMGPYDPVLQEYIEREFVGRKWFQYNEDEPLKYRPLEKAGGHKADFDKYFANDKTAIHHLIKLFVNARSSKMEIVATLFACWEEMLKKNQLVNDTALLASFYNWSEKKKKYAQEKVIDELRWMEREGIVPVN